MDLHDREAFAQRLDALFGQQQASAIVQALATSRTSVCYWFNPLCYPGGQLPQRSWPEDNEVVGMPGVYRAGERDRITRSAEAAQGQVYIQNPSSLLAVRLLDAQPGEEVLDLAAAPGGKTIALAVAMQNRGRLAAVEPVARRFHRLKANVARCGVDIVEFYQRDGRGVGRAVGERFDRVLLDAPCSSESRMRWDNPASYQHWQLRKIKETQRKQKSLLRSAYASLKPGGTLLYSTCSLNLEENELVVDHLVKRSDAVIDPVEISLAHTRPGFEVHRGKPLAAGLGRALRILPTDDWDGFFLARLRKPA